MSLLGLLIALSIALFGFGIIVADLERRQLPKQTKYLWAGCCGGAIMSGFLVPALHDGVYTFVRELLYGPEDHILTPIQQDMPILLAGLTLAVIVNIIYLFGSRIR